MTDRELMQQALEALEFEAEGWQCVPPTTREAIAALRDRLAEPEQEPVAWSFEARHIDTAWGLAVSLKHPGQEHKYLRNVKPLYTAPPQREPLTEEEIGLLTTDPRFAHIETPTLAEFARAVIAKATGEKE